MRQLPFSAVPTSTPMQLTMCVPFPWSLSLCLFSRYRYRYRYSLIPPHPLFLLPHDRLLRSLCGALRPKLLIFVYPSMQLLTTMRVGALYGGLERYVDTALAPAQRIFIAEASATSNPSTLAEDQGEGNTY